MLKTAAATFVFLLTSTLAFAQYPEQYYGPPLESAGCVEIEAYTPEGWYLDRNPWSAPSPEERFIWFGELCVDGPVAVLTFESFSYRVCHPTFYGPDECMGWGVFVIRIPDRHVMTWDPEFETDWGFYQAAVQVGEWAWAYDSLTNLGDGTAMYSEGVWEFEQPLWWVESDEFTRWQFIVSERSTPVFTNRTAGLRVGR